MKLYNNLVLIKTQALIKRSNLVWLIIKSSMMNKFTSMVNQSAVINVGVIWALLVTSQRAHFLNSVFISAPNLSELCMQKEY